jgi:tRNA pseudouridine38-40 synthase
VARPPPLTSPEARGGDGPDWRDRLPEGTRNVLLTIEYDGSTFSGWQIQPEQRTVQGVLTDALRTLCGHDVVLRGSGRTDAGVHAWAQQATVYTDCDLPLAKFVKGVTGIVKRHVAVVAATEVPLDFDARRNAVGKVYVYRLLLRNPRSPLLDGRAWHLRQTLDVDVLKAELATLAGTADWSAYRSADCGSPDPVKTIYSATVRQEGRDVLALEFRGSGFLKQMVRILVGTAVEVAIGRWPPGSMVAIRDGQNRAKAGPTAPPHGLYLEEVLYP